MLFEPTFWIAGAAAIAGAATVFALRSRRAYDQVSDELQRQSELIANLHEGVYRSSLDGRPLSSNPAMVRLSGFSSEEEQMRSIKDFGDEYYVDPDRRKEFQAILARDGKIEDFISEIYRHKTRERIWVTESARVVHDRRSGEALYYEGSIHEITQTMERLQLEERFRKLTDHLPVGLCQFEVKGGRARTIYLNRRWEEITGIPRLKQMHDATAFLKLIHAEDLDTFESKLGDAVRAVARFECKFRFHRQSGQTSWLKIACEPEVDGRKIRYHGYVVDISDTMAQQQEISELAYFDPLTRLPNRREFFRQMAAALALRRQRNDVGMLLYIDLDNFKTLNDTQGHEIGDAFLREAAQRLLAVVRPQDTVARIGGDEFVVILNGAGVEARGAADYATDVAQRMLAAIRAGFTYNNVRHMTSASIGVVPFGVADDRAEEILKRADMAMYRAKSAGRNSIGLFDPSDIEAESARYALAIDLADALAARKLELYLQPKIDRLGRVQGAEALLRWNHPEHGVVSPDRFLAIAERFGLSADIERLVLVKGMQILKSWAEHPATASYRLALNITAHSFASDEFVPLVQNHVREAGIEPDRLIFELTEHVMAKDQKSVAEKMRALNQLGIRLSLDDFGTGYSSLSYLKEMPFDEVKVDGRFVADIETDEGNRALVKTILVMAQTLGLETVAEHVETHAQEDFLREEGCDYFQGYLYSPAVEVKRFSEMVAALAKPVTTGKKSPAKKKKAG